MRELGVAFSGVVVQIVVVCGGFGDVEDHRTESWDGAEELKRCESLFRKHGWDLVEKAYFA
jgi:hypothetical protein